MEANTTYVVAQAHQLTGLEAFTFLTAAAMLFAFMWGLVKLTAKQRSAAEIRGDEIIERLRRIDDRLQCRKE